jgi:hypothetical protein
VIPGQESIPVGQHVPVAHPCAWCGKLAHDHIEIEPARWRNHNGVRVEAKAARTAPACKTHYRTIARTEKS